MRKKISILVIMLIICITLTPIASSVYSQGTFEKQSTTQEKNTIIYDEIDQSQTVQNSLYYLSRWYSYSQSFQPKFSSLTKVQIYLRHSGATNNVIMAIRDDLHGSDLTSTIVDADTIPINSWTWVDFNFEDIIVTPDNTYYILVYHISGGDLDVIAWGCSTVNVYYRGTGYENEIGTDIWNLLDNVDFCFKTYGQENMPPETPDPPAGPGNGKVLNEYTYTVSTTDIDDNYINFKFDWGDGTESEWSSTPVPSDVEYAESHTWLAEGTYPIKVKARDNPYGAESDWSAPYYVSMPKNKNIIFPTLINRLIQHYPIIKQLITNTAI